MLTDNQRIADPCQLKLREWGMGFDRGISMGFFISFWTFFGFCSEMAREGSKYVIMGDRILPDTVW